jgi:hypothetical protein
LGLWVLALARTLNGLSSEICRTKSEAASLLLAFRNFFTGPAGPTFDFLGASGLGFGARQSEPPLDFAFFMGINFSEPKNPFSLPIVVNEKCLFFRIDLGELWFGLGIFLSG